MPKHFTPSEEIEIRRAALEMAVRVAQINNGSGRRTASVTAYAKAFEDYIKTGKSYGDK